MTAVAVSVDSRDCTTPGCVGESAWAKGPQVGLCVICAADDRRRRLLETPADRRRARAIARRNERIAAATLAAAAAIYGFDSGESWADLDDEDEIAFYTGRATAALAAIGLAVDEPGAST